MYNQILACIFCVLTFGDVSNSNKHVKLEGKIVGGDPIEIENVPYQLSLRLKNRHICGASLLQANIALTAAHCTNKNPSIAFQVYGGSTSATADGQVSQALIVCQHPKFSNNIPVYHDYDVSVILFSPKFVLSPKIQNITLESDPKKLKPGDKVLVTGWGTLQEGVGNYPDTLQSVEVSFISRKECRAQYGEKNITDRMICLGYEEGGRDSCENDFGGPAVFENKEIGIVSSGKGCAEPKYAGIYTDVTNKEIYNHIQGCVKYFNSFTFLP